MTDKIIDKINEIPVKKAELSEEINFLSDQEKSSLYTVIDNITTKLMAFGSAKNIVPASIFHLLVNIYECKGYKIEGIFQDDNVRTIIIS